MQITSYYPVLMSTMSPRPRHFIEPTLISSRVRGDWYVHLQSKVQENVALAILQAITTHPRKARALRAVF